MIGSYSFGKQISAKLPIVEFPSVVWQIFKGLRPELNLESYGENLTINKPLSSGRDTIASGSDSLIVLSSPHIIRSSSPYPGELLALALSDISSGQHTPIELQIIQH